MLILGLTGSIGMGKSATANIFREAGVPVHDSDRAVHQLYEGEAVPAIEAAFPGVTVDGKVDREKLSAQVLGKPDAFKRLEAIVHPLVRQVSVRFLDAARARGAR
ncbi:MAG: dephospho-CoA kinase, partial [Rhizobiales bacterium]|nr:dephospho-CoA kinase [Hyphomicrobiales bacterium]